MQWLRDNLKIIRSSSESKACEERRGQRRGVHRARVLEAVRALLEVGRARRHCGLTRYVNGGHLARAALEAGFQSREVADAMNADSGVDLESLKVDGGMVVNETLMQFPGRHPRRAGDPPKVAETTSLGAAYAAGLAWPLGEIEDLRENWVEDKRWEPQMDAAARDEAYRFWKKAVTRTFDWAE